MAAVFREVIATAGVQEDAIPRPGMIVPVGGSNVVRLAGGTGLRLDKPSALKVEDLPPIPGVVLTALSFAWNLAGFPPLKPGALSGDRYLRISGSTPTGAVPTQVKAFAAGGSKPEAALDVAVLRQRKVKLSIRPVQVLDSHGGLVFHSKQPFDAKDMVEQMNFIWTPQANVAFELVSQSPVQIVDEAEIAKILDLKTADKASLPTMVVLQRFSGLFNRLKDKSADLTMFLVESVLGISLIGDARTSQRELMAHEAGHFIGSDFGSDGKLVLSFGHRGGTRDLMQDGGSAIARVPFHDVIEFFNRP